MSPAITTSPTIAWDELVDGLSRVEWHEPGTADQARVRGLLDRVYADPAVITRRTQEILASDKLLEELRSFHSYPRILMEKLVLYVSPEDNFRIRLHRFNSRKNTGGAKEKGHSHKWPSYSLILKGAYKEERFTIDELDVESGRAVLSAKDVVMRRPGDIDFKPVRQPHRVSVDSEREPCFTLFIRGGSVEPHGMMFDLDENRIVPWLSATSSLRTGLRDLGELRSDFY